MSMRYFCPLWVALVALTLLAGCRGSGPTIVPVTGVLTYKGKAVPNAIVDFMPESGRPSWGLTDAQGRFTLEYDKDNKGVLVGKHKVSARIGPGGEKVPGERAPIPKDLEGLFDKYGMENTKYQVVIDRDTKEVNLNWD